MLAVKMKCKDRTLTWKRKQFVWHASPPAYPLSAFFTENDQQLVMDSDSWSFLKAAAGFAIVARHRQNGSAFLFPNCSAKNSATKNNERSNPSILNSGSHSEQHELRKKVILDLRRFLLNDVRPKDALRIVPYFVFPHLRCHFGRC